MANHDRGPRVPEGPALINPRPADRDPIAPAADPTGGEAKSAGPERRIGGRRPYEEILEENRILAERVQVLLPLVSVLASIPIDPQTDPKRPQYILSKSGKPFALLGEPVLAARAAMGIPV